jgi:hypothetical protein
MNGQSQQNVLFFSEIYCFTTCFGQHGHFQVIQLCTEYVGGNCQHKVLYKELGFYFFYIKCNK